MAGGWGPEGGQIIVTSFLNSLLLLKKQNLVLGLIMLYLNFSHKPDQIKYLFMQSNRL